VLLGRAVKKLTQRVNLFEKVLIRRALAQIRKIPMLLGNAEPAGVVTAEFAKAPQAAAG